MLKNVIEFVTSRTGLDRETALREINYAWSEIWTTDDLPNSLFEVTVKPFDRTARISLAPYVGLVKGVKEGKLTVALNTPRPYYQDGEYQLSPWTHRILGTSPLAKSVANASTLRFRLSQPETQQVIISLEGPTDNATVSNESLIIEVGEEEVESTLCFSDLTSATKNVLTLSNVSILGPNDEELGYIPNNAYEGKNTVIQITDKCNCVCTSCQCFDILFKKPVPILVNDNTSIPYEDVLATKTMEWIMLPKEGGEQKAAMFGDKSTSLLGAHNRNGASVDHKMEFGRNKFTTCHYGYL